MCILTAVFVCGAEPAFGIPAATYGTGTDPRQLQVRDLTGDGHPDLIYADQGDGMVVMRPYDVAQGAFAGPVTLATFPGVSATTFADLDGDGAPDLVMLSGTLPQAGIAYGDGHGYFTGATATLPLPGIGQDVCIAKAGTDALSSIFVTVRAATDSVVHHRQMTPRGFAPFLMLGLKPGANPAGIVASALGTHAYQDLLIACEGTSELAVLTGNADTTFATASYSSSGPGARQVQLLDTNNGGNPRYAVVTNAGAAASSLTQFAPSADGATIQVRNPAFSAVVPLHDLPPVGIVWGVAGPPILSDPSGDAVLANRAADITALQVGMLPGDIVAMRLALNGNPQDLSMLSGGDARWNIMLMSGGSEFTCIIRPALPIAVAMTKDGVAILSHGATAALLGDAVELRLPLSTLVGNGYVTGSPVTIAAISERNGAGGESETLDETASHPGALILAAGGLSSCVQVSRQTVDLALSAQITPRETRVADLDGDVDPDLAILDAQANRVYWLRNRGSSVFQHSSPSALATLPLPGAGGMQRSLRVADLDGDGDQDLAVLTNHGPSAAGAIGIYLQGVQTVASQCVVGLAWPYANARLPAERQFPTGVAVSGLPVGASISKVDYTVTLPGLDAQARTEVPSNRSPALRADWVAGAAIGAATATAKVTFNDDSTATASVSFEIVAAPAPQFALVQLPAPAGFTRSSGSIADLSSDGGFAVGECSGGVLARTAVVWTSLGTTPLAAVIDPGAVIPDTMVSSWARCVNSSGDVVGFALSNQRGDICDIHAWARIAGAMHHVALIKADHALVDDDLLDWFAFSDNGLIVGQKDAGGISQPYSWRWNGLDAFTETALLPAIQSGTNTAAVEASAEAVSPNGSYYGGGYGAGGVFPPYLDRSPEDWDIAGLTLSAGDSGWLSDITNNRDFVLELDSVQAPRRVFRFWNSMLREIPPLHVGGGVASNALSDLGTMVGQAVYHWNGGWDMTVAAQTTQGGALTPLHWLVDDSDLDAADGIVGDSHQGSLWDAVAVNNGPATVIAVQTGNGPCLLRSGDQAPGLAISGPLVGAKGQILSWSAQVADDTGVNNVTLVAFATSDGRRVQLSDVTIGTSGSTRAVQIAIRSDAMPGDVELTFRVQDFFGNYRDVARTVTVGEGTPTATISLSNPVDEDSDQTGAFTVTLSSAAPAGGLQLDLAVTGTAIEGDDFTALPTSVTVPAGQTALSIPLTLIDDSDPEDAETIILTLLDNGFVPLGSPASATATIPHSDVQEWVFWVLHNYVNGADTGTASLVWWMTTATPVASATFTVPGRDPVPADIGDGGTRLCFPFREVFRQESVAIDDLDAYLPDSPSLATHDYECAITYAGGATEVRKGSFIWDRALDPPPVPVTAPVHGGMATLTALGLATPAWTGPLNCIGIRAFNGRNGDRERWEDGFGGTYSNPAVPDQVSSVTAGPMLVGGQPYVFEFMRMSGGVGDSEHGSSDVGLGSVNSVVASAATGTGMPVFPATSADLASTLLGAIPPVSGLAGSETASGVTRSISVEVTHEAVILPGTATSVQAVKLSRSWNGGRETRWIAKDVLGDVYVVKAKDFSSPLVGDADTTGPGPCLLLPATVVPSWYSGTDEALRSLFSSNATAPGNGSTGCVQLRSAYGPDDHDDWWFKSGVGLVAKTGIRGGETLVSWHVAPGGPVPTLASASGNLLNGAFGVTCTFSVAVTGFVASDVTVVGGTLSAFSGSGAGYAWTVTPNAVNVSVSVAAGRCTAAVGGTANLASAVLTRTYDAVKPSVTLSTPTTAPTGPFTVTATFSEAVSGFTIEDVVVTNGTVSDFGGATGSWTVAPLVSGPVTVALAAGAVVDAAGNPSTAAVTLSRTANLGSPGVILSSAAPERVKAAFSVTINFSAAMSGFASDDLVVTGASKGALTTVTAGRTYSCVLTPTTATEGTVTIDVPAGAATSGGIANAAAVTLTRLADTRAPVIDVDCTAFPATVTGPFAVQITASEATDVLAAADLVLVNCTVGTITPDVPGHAWEVIINPLLNGTVSVGVKAGALLDLAGNTNAASGILSRTLVDATPPTVVLTSSAGGFINKAYVVTATFSEDPGTSFMLADAAVSNGTASLLAGTGLVRTFTVTPAAQGETTVQVAASAFADRNGQFSTAASNVLSTVFDTAKPTPMLATTAAAQVNGAFDITITCAEPLVGLVAGDLTVTNGTVGAFGEGGGDGMTFTATVTPTASGTVTVALAAGKASDRAGNLTNVAVSLVRQADVIRPTVILASTAPAVTRSSPIVVSAVFSEAMSGFEVADLVLVNATATASSPDGRTWSISLTPVADGAVSVQIPGAAATDAAGNTNQASSVLGRVFDRTSPTFVLASTAASPVTGAFPLTITASEPVSGLLATEVVVSNGVVTAFAGSGAVYTCTIRPTAVGEVGVTMAAGVAIDVAGNASLAATPLTRTVTVANNDFAAAVVLDGWKGTVSGANFAATAQAGEPAHGGLAAVRSVWWAWTAPETGKVTIDTLGSLIDTQLAVYAGAAVESLTLVGGNADVSTAVKQSRVLVPVVKGTVYAIAVDGKAGAQGLITLNWSLVAGNNVFTASRAITGTSGTDTSGTWNANRDSGENPFGAIGAGQTVWWSYTAPADGTLQIGTDGSGIDTVLGVATGTAVGSLTVRALDDDVPGDTCAEVGLKVQAGQVYRIMVDASAASVTRNGAVVLTWALDPSGGG